MKKQKNKPTLYYVELRGFEGIEILLVSKSLIDWIEGKITAPPDLQLAWTSNYHNIADIIKNLEPGSGSSPDNDRALSIPVEACVAYFDEAREYADWLVQNHKKYIIKDGYYGAIY